MWRVTTKGEVISKRGNVLKDKRKVFFVAIFISIVLAFLFYRSIWGMLCFPIVFRLTSQREKEVTKVRMEQKLLEEFVNGICILSTSLQAGFSMENAWREVQKELLLMYGEEAFFYKEVKEMNHSIVLNIPVEQVMLSFAYRSG